MGSFATGGLGGKQVGAPVDALASQGALALTDDGRAVVAVNAGSDSVSLLRIGDDELRLRSVVPSRGAFPSSVAVHGALAFVLNAGGDGSVAGFRIRGDHLVAIPGSRRTLGLGNDAVPFFLGSPSQVGVTK